MDPLYSVITGVLGIIASIIVYFQLKIKLETKKVDVSKEIIDAKETATDALFQKLEMEIGLIQSAFETMKADLQKFNDGAKQNTLEVLGSLKTTEQKFADLQKTASRVFEALKEFVKTTETKFKWTEQRFNKMDSWVMKHDRDIVQLTNKYNELIIIKGTKGGK